MRVAVLGAGIAGITTAYELAKLGHEVSVFDQRTTPAEEASFAVAGACGTGYASHWAWNSAPAQWGSDLWSPHSPVRLSGVGSFHEWAWLWQWLRASKQPNDAARRQALHQLAQLSTGQLAMHRHELALEFDEIDGYGILLRSDAERLEMVAHVEQLKQQGIAIQELDANATRKLEPGINPDTALAGAVFMPGEKTANCRQFVLMLKKACETLGAVFYFDHTVAPLQSAQPTHLLVTAPDLPVQEWPFEAVVVCSGTGSASLLTHLIPKLPGIAVHGYSISAHIREPLNAPRHSYLDWKHRVHLTRLGQRVRVSGLAVLGDPLAKKMPTHLKTLYQVLLDWFPGAAHMNQVQQWRGTRICTPDGLPLLGVSGVPGVWLNTAHGDVGWTIGCGAAYGLASMIGGQTIDGVDWQQFGLARFTRS